MSRPSLDVAPARRRHVALGLLLAVLALTFGGVQSVIGPAFGYPGIAEGPPGEMFRAFEENRRLVSTGFYLTALVELLRIPIAIGFLLLLPRSFLNLTLAAFFGVAGVLRALDYVLWTFLTPRLADAWLDPASSEATRDAAELVFTSMFSYLGDALGGNLGLLLITLWVAGVAVEGLRRGVLPGWLAVIGLASAVGVGVNYVEFLGTPTGIIGLIGTVGQVLVYLWFLLLGVYLAARGVAVPAAVDPQPTPISVR